VARKDPAAIVAGAGLLTGIFTALNDAVEEIGGSDEDLHRLTKPEGGDVIKAMAQLIVAANDQLHLSKIRVQFLPREDCVSSRLLSLLTRAGLETAYDVVTKTEAEIYRLNPNIEDRDFQELRVALESRGLSMRDE
jgi:hypothetical protein